MNEELIRILVATDNHVGFLERHPVRGDDSFNTFEEIMRTAREMEVDFVLLGGDLFHDNKPSRKTLHRTMEIFRKYCFGDRSVQVQVVSDQKMNFRNSSGCVNYEDPNFNIDLPVFIVHGNHDDPSGDGDLSAIDLLAATNLLNYFGRAQDLKEIHLAPVLITKGSSKIALYGLGNIRDERLYRIFREKNVKWVTPAENRQDWFNIFVIHQNREGRNSKSTITEQMLAPFLDFVIWGHEHESLINPWESSAGGFFVVQPGSTVATSLIEGEAKPKHMALLEVSGKEHRFTPIRLKTVRPFIMEDITLSVAQPPLDPKDTDAVTEYLAEKVEEMIEVAAREHPPDPDYPNLHLPLIKLRVDYSGGFSTINPQRFGQRFVQRVANSEDILLFVKRRTQEKGKKTAADTTAAEFADLHRSEPLDQTRIDDLVMDMLRSHQLQILPQNDFASAVQKFVEKDEKLSINEFVLKSLEDTQNFLFTQPGADVDKPDELQGILASRPAESSSAPATRPLGDSSSAAPQAGPSEPRASDAVVLDDEDDGFDAPAAPPPSRRKGQATSQAATTAKQKAAPRKAAAAAGSKLKQTTLSFSRGTASVQDEGEEEESPPKPKPKRPRKAG
eukprot:tig00000350_g24315.t1